MCAFALQNGVGNTDHIANDAIVTLCIECNVLKYPWTHLFTSSSCQTKTFMLFFVFLLCAGSSWSCRKQLMKMTRCSVEQYYSPS